MTVWGERVEEENLSVGYDPPTSRFWEYLILFFLGGFAGFMIGRSLNSSLYFPYPAADSRLVNQMLVELRKIGSLPPIKEDLTIGDGDDLMQQERHQIIVFPPVENYLKKILDCLLVSVSAIDQGNVFRLRIYEDRYQDKFSAKAISGGVIYLGASFLLEANNEAEVAEVIAHEMGHLIKRHYAKARLYERNFTRLRNQFKKERKTKELLALAMARLQFLGDYYSRIPGILTEEEQEEADQQGQQILEQAGYDSTIMFSLGKDLIDPKRIAAARLRSSEFYKTHPPGKLFLAGSLSELRFLQASLKLYLDQTK